jgi:hypothetical protein
MREITNPLDNIKIASPCGADWSKMYGSDRKRFCAECKLNVYNISEMTQVEAENFILRSEGRLCLRIHRRGDGTVITQDCPVGWARVKRRASLVYKAAVGLAAGFIAAVFGIGALRGLDSISGQETGETVSVKEVDEAVPVQVRLPRSSEGVSFGMGSPESLESVGVKILTSRF